MAYGTGVTQCPHCGSVGTYKITMQQGGQVITIAGSYPLELDLIFATGLNAPNLDPKEFTA